MAELLVGNGIFVFMNELDFGKLLDELHSIVHVDFINALRELPPYTEQGFDFEKYKQYCWELFAEHEPFRKRVGALMDKLKASAKNPPSDKAKRKELFEGFISIREQYNKITSKEYLEKYLIADINAKAAESGITIKDAVDEESGLVYQYQQVNTDKKGVPLILWQQQEAFIEIFCLQLESIKDVLEQYIGIYNSEVIQRPGKVSAFRWIGSVEGIDKLRIALEKDGRNIKNIDPDKFKKAFSGEELDESLKISWLSQNHSNAPNKIELFFFLDTLAVKYLINRTDIPEQDEGATDLYRKITKIFVDSNGHPVQNLRSSFGAFKKLLSNERSIKMKLLDLKKALAESDDYVIKGDEAREMHKREIHEKHIKELCKELNIPQDNIAIKELERKIGTIRKRIESKRSKFELLLKGVD